jgi:hypothetical protein
VGAVETNRRTRLLNELNSNLTSPRDEMRYIDADITEAEITRAIIEKSDSATSKDVLSYTILKRLALNIIKMIRNLFNSVWKTGTIPKD